MTDIVFYFQVHQPFRLRRYTWLDIGVDHDYFDDPLNQMIVERVAERCYLPMNRVLLEAIERTQGRFRCSFSISGTALEQFELWAPAVLESFRALAATGAVEFLCETRQHSLAALEDPEEFRAQVADQRALLKRLFGVAPTSFRDTELITDESVARQVEALGFNVLMGEGADTLLNGRPATTMYRPRGTQDLTLLLRSYSYSDDIAFRFSNRSWDAYPLFAPTFVDWLMRVPEDAPFVGLFMDYETFGEHQWAETGIFDFMRALPELVLARKRFRFATPAEAAESRSPRVELAYPRTYSWADAERDLSAWLGNPMQKAAQRALYDLAAASRAAGASATPEGVALYEDWRKLSTSDHVYYMATKWASDGDVHEYFSPYDSPHDAFILFMNVIEDLANRLRGFSGSTSAPRAPSPPHGKSGPTGPSARP
ncbi:MAG: glycoside hydrolase family 57 protein [Planctomycetota bacterium]